MELAGWGGAQVARPGGLAYCPRLQKSLVDLRNLLFLTNTVKYEIRTQKWREYSSDTARTLVSINW